MSYAHVQLATDLAPDACEAPWVHALRLAAAGAGRVSVVHAGSSHPWSALRPAEDYLVRWGCAPVPVDREPVSGSAARSVPQRVTAESPDLLVLGTHRPRGMARMLWGSVAARVLRRRGMGATLVVPDGARPLVDIDTGAVRLRRVLVPIGDDADQQAAVEAAVRFVELLGGDDEVELVLLHRRRCDDMPPLLLPESECWSWRREELEDAPIVAAILEGVRRWDASLVVMVSHGHDSVEDALFGSYTENVLQHVSVPVLVVRR
jgi:nucleotide-binding universal stress UspA family protein